MPDAQSLVFTSRRSGNNDIYRMAVPPSDGPMPAAGGAPAPVVTHPADDRDPAVNRSGTMVFLSNRDGIMRTYLLDSLALTYPAIYARTDTDRPEGHPAWIDDLARMHVLLEMERDGETTIFRRAPGGSAAESVPLAASPAFEGQPAWGAVWWTPDSVLSREWLEDQESRHP